MRKLHFDAYWIMPLLVVSLVWSTADASEPAGEAVAVFDLASATGQVGDRKLTAGAMVYLGDRVETNGTGEAQLVFRDETRMVVGPHSSLVIDEFVFRSGATENRLGVRALGGAFRFISGRSGERAYSIRTPSGTIAVRGTAFDISVTPDDTGIIVMDGQVVLCGNDGSCEAATRSCDMVWIRREAGPEEVRDREQRRSLAASRFPYLRGQAALRPKFRVSSAGSCAAEAALGSRTSEEDGAGSSRPSEPNEPSEPSGNDDVNDTLGGNQNTGTGGFSEPGASQ